MPNIRSNCDAMYYVRYTCRSKTKTNAVASHTRSSSDF